MEEAKPKFDGEIVRIGDRDFVLPSLTVKQAKQLWPQMLELDKGITPENLPTKYEDALKVIHAALARNYSEVTMEALEDLVEIKDLRRLLLVVSGQSGMRTAPGGAVPDAATTVVH